MTDDEITLHRLNVRVGATPTVCYFSSQVEFEKARGFARQLGIGPVADKETSTMPQDSFVADAIEFRKGALGLILSDQRPHSIVRRSPIRTYQSAGRRHGLNHHVTTRRTNI